ncbi:MAG: hypothetical protein GY780_08355 [bacterium]|nr:hypothetical protein [bacterium]
MKITIAPNLNIRSTLAVLIFLFIPTLGFSAALTALRPLGQVEEVAIGKKEKVYLVVGDSTVKVPIIGPGQITGYARVAMPTEGSAAIGGTLTLGGLPGAPQKLPFQFKASRRSSWSDSRPGAPSGGRKFILEVPEGEFNLSLNGSATSGDPILVILYYDGPAQPDLPGLAKSAPVAKTPKKKKKNSVSWLSNASLDVIYNSNILGNSPDYVDEFESGFNAYKFKHDTTDDMVIAPSFNIEARVKWFSFGQSRFKFRVKHWMYAVNPIKTNTDFDFYIRQLLGKKSSLELYLHTAPAQYIRELSDRSPFDDPDSDLVYHEFRFQRNIWNLTWRQKLNNKLSFKLLYEENYRYYNEWFVENDIEAWEIRGNITWKLNRSMTWNFDYSYEDATARAIDTVGELPGNSDDSDGSYARDLYRIGVDLKHSSFKKYVDRIGLSFLFMDYYFTTDKTLAEDPFHAGRRDVFYKGTIEVRKKIAKPLTLKLAVRRTERVVYSPWEGDITTDKDFSQWLFWFSLNYRF